jgi:phosphoenolpyruvate carboxykinase (GTP)
VTTVGDDIAWIKPDANGQLRAINPEAGFFGVAPGTSQKTNPNAMAMLSRNTIFTNVALTPRRVPDGVWWEGMTDEPFPPSVFFNRRLARPAVDAGDRQANRRQGRASEWPLYGAGCAMPVDRSRVGRSPRRANQRVHFWRPPRSTTMPLVYQAFNWSSGVYAGATMGSETTAAAGRGGQGAPRSHGHAALLRLSHGRLLPALAQDAAQSLSVTPRIFHVNWFRKDDEGKFLWPGFSENMRVLKWIVDRVHGRAQGKETPIGWTPYYEDMSSGRGWTFPREQFEAMQEVSRAAWRKEILGHEELFLDVHDHLPPEMIYERELLICRL